MNSYEIFKATNYISILQVWDFETVDNAESTDESTLFEMEPMNELKVGSNVALKSIVKSPDEEEPTMWFAQVLII